MSLLEIEDLSVTFRTDRGMVRAVDSVDLHVDAGETLAIVGESGSGKSVTALSILQLIGDNGSIERGEIRFDGTNLLGLDGDAIRDVRGDPSRTVRLRHRSERRSRIRRVPRDERRRALEKRVDERVRLDDAPARWTRRG